MILFTLTSLKADPSLDMSYGSAVHSTGRPNSKHLMYIRNTIDLRLVGRQRRDLSTASTLALIGCVLVGIRLGEDDGILLGYL